MRCCSVCVAVFVVMPLISAEQPGFETASVKPLSRCSSIHNSIDPGIVALNGDPLSVVLMEAFKVKMDQIIGPSWLDTACFSIVAKVPDGATKDQLPAMFQALLAERFKLAAHKEIRRSAGYALMVDKNGPKFKESDPNSPYAKAHAGQVAFGWGPRTSIKGSITMARLAHFVSGSLDTPVQDLTGLKGKYDIDVSWTPDRTVEKMGPLYPDAVNGNGAGMPAAAAGDDIFSAFRKTLGLRLERSKQQVEILVVDHIERVPTPN